MKIVTLNRALRPWGKDDQAVLPDDMAQRLVDSGEARDLRELGAAHATATLPPVVEPKRQGYQTRRKA